MDLERLAAVGLYDPDASESADRRDLLAYLVAAGATVGEMVEAHRHGNLASLAFDLQLRRGDLSAGDLAQRSAVPLSQVIETYRLLGIAVADPSEPMFGQQEARLFEMLSSQTVALPEGMTEEILRSIG